MNIKSVNTVCITVTYNPDITILEEQISSVVDQALFVIVDNGSSNAEQILAILAKYPESMYRFVALGENHGIAAAQNRGVIETANEFAETEFLLFLDHDSIPDSNFVDTIQRQFQFIQKEDSKVGAIGPSLFDPRDNKLLGFHVVRGLKWSVVTPYSKKQSWIQVNSLNGSGTFLRRAVFEKLSGYDEDFFIDHVDSEWSFRLQSFGYSLYGTSACSLTHNMGDRVIEYSFMGKKKRMPYRSPIRHYYIFRNSILLQRRDYVSRVWKLWNLPKLVFTFIYFSTRVDDANLQRKYMYLGILHGIRGTTGSVKPNPKSES